MPSTTRGAMGYMSVYPSTKCTMTMSTAARTFRTARRPMRSMRAPMKGLRKPAVKYVMSMIWLALAKTLFLPASVVGSPASGSNHLVAMKLAAMLLKGSTAQYTVRQDSVMIQKVMGKAITSEHRTTSLSTSFSCAMSSSSDSGAPSPSAFSAAYPLPSRAPMAGDSSNPVWVVVVSEWVAPGPKEGRATSAPRDPPMAAGPRRSVPGESLAMSVKPCGRLEVRVGVDSPCSRAVEPEAELAGAGAGLNAGDWYEPALSVFRLPATASGALALRVGRAMAPDMMRESLFLASTLTALTSM